MTENLTNSYNVDLAPMQKMLSVPVAVFTATYGYGWSQLPNWMSEREADNLYEIISKKVTNSGLELSNGDILEGVIYNQNYALVFRLMQVKKWDQANRDANYCACAFVSQEEIGHLDFAELIKMPYFNEPSRNPRAEMNCNIINYDEELRLELDKAIEELYAGVQNVDWRLIGPLLARYGKMYKRLFFSCLIKGGIPRFEIDINDEMSSNSHYKPITTIEECTKVSRESDVLRSDAIRGALKSEYISSLNVMYPEVPRDRSEEIKKYIEEKFEKEMESLNNKLQAYNNTYSNGLRALQRDMSQVKWDIRQLQCVKSNAFLKRLTKAIKDNKWLLIIGGVCVLVVVLLIVFL